MAVNFSIKYRPARIGFLVRDGHIEDLVTAAGINSLLWGGIHNPIIPISDGVSDSLPKLLLQSFLPDTFYKVAHTEAINAFVNEYPFFKDPGHYGDNIFHQEWGTNKNEVAYLDVMNIIERLWHKDFKNKKPDHISNCNLMTWDDRDPLNSVFALNFGFFPKTYNLKDDFENAFLQGLRSRKIEIGHNAPIEARVGTGVSPIQLTDVELKGYGGGRNNYGIFLGRSDSFEDLLAFWNLRASGGAFQFCPIDHLDRAKPYITAFFESLDKIPNSHPQIEDMITVYSSCTDDEIQETLKRFTTKKPKAVSRYQRQDAEVIWNGMNIRPSYVCFPWQRASGTVENDFGRYQVELSLPEKKFLEFATERRNVDFQILAVNIDAYSDFGYPKHTLRPPCIPALNEFYSREIMFDPWKLRVQREGFSLIIKVIDESESFYPIEHQKLIERIFEYAGIKTEIGQPGRIASKIISSMREYDPLEACRVFKITGIRKLLRGLRADASIKWNEALRVIWNEEGFKRFQNLYIESRKSKNLQPKDAFNFLVKKNILKPRLRIFERLVRERKEYKCTGCGLASRILLSDFENDQWGCPYCFEKQNLRPLIIQAFRDRPKIWNFVKIGLFARENSQEGAIPVILSLLTFARVFEANKMLYSTALNLKVGNRPFETDFVVFQHDRGDDYELAVGEVKDEGGTIDQNDVNSLKIAREKLVEKGLSCYLVFAKTADAFSQDELDLFRGLEGEHIPFILFTNAELEPYHPYWENPRVKELPYQYALTMSEMAINSRFLYLGSVKGRTI